MKRIFIIILILYCLLHSITSEAQVGIGTITPDSSAILDLSSTEKGLLVPRLSTIQRDSIQAPATGLLIYNLTTHKINLNSGTPLVPVWIGINDSIGSTILSITATGDITTSSMNNVLVPGMTITPAAGTYLVFFNGQYGLNASEPINTADVAADLLSAYNAIMAIPVTNSTHGAVFGNGETITPGIYNVAGAASMAGVLTLDGLGDTNSLFVFRIGGALSTGAGTTVLLVNGARSNNIFWVSEGALSLGANTTMKGTLISHSGAVSAAAGTDLEGRMFTLAGAISFGPGTAIIPEGTTNIELGSLSSFVIFSSAGAVSNTNPSDITGDVGNNGGAVAGFEDLDGNIYSPGYAPPPVNNTITTFSIYQNGVLVANSSRTSDINTSVMTLQAMATISAGQSIEVWWKVDEGPVKLGNRILTLVKAD